MLGLRWNPLQDFFSFAMKPSAKGTATKRSLLSQTAQLFDPLGWLTPVIIRAMIAIHSAWLTGLDWDSPLPECQATQWQQLMDELPLLSHIKIPRALNKGSAPSEQELHRFADASEKAYAAVLYIKNKINQNTSLVMAKSKVAPIKQVSLPRLELCAALLLARLVKYATNVLDLKETQKFLWTDSTVTLHWIQGHPSKWKTYVASWVAEIQLLTPEARWSHLPGRDNPADCASRGLSPRELLQYQL